MNIADRIKHAPRWTWYTIAGVTIGTIGIKLWTGRDAPPPEQVADDGTMAGDEYSGGSWQAPGALGSPSVIVPPIINGATQGGDDGAVVAGAIGGAFDNLTGLLGYVVAGDQENTRQLIGAFVSQADANTQVLMQAGEPPSPADQAPTPVVITMPAAVAPAVAGPPRPRAIGHKKQPTTTHRPTPATHKKPKRKPKSHPRKR